MLGLLTFSLHSTVRLYYCNLLALFYYLCAMDKSESCSTPLVWMLFKLISFLRLGLSIYEMTEDYFYPA